VSDKDYNFKAPSTKSVLAFLFLPEFKRSFPAFAHIGPIFIRTIAIMFVQAGLLRPNHPAVMYGLAKNVPQFKFSDLIGEAWYNLRVNEGNTPYQYGMFIGVIMMICLTVVTAFMFLLNLFVSSAQAQIFAHPTINTDVSAAVGNTGTGIYQVNPTSPDFAIDILNKVVRQSAYGDGAPLSVGLGAVMGVYNTALLVIAALVVFWAIISIIVDTARTGQIGGGRHSIVWVPIRFVFALALMIPLGTGFSGGQVITLKIAEWGSNLGTNGWIAYVDRVNDATLISSKTPSDETAVDLAVGLARIEICRQTYNALNAQASGFLSNLSNALTGTGGGADAIADMFRAGSVSAASGSMIYYRYQGLLSGLNDQPRPPTWGNLGSGFQPRSEVQLYVGNDMVADYCGKLTVQNPDPLLNRNITQFGSLGTQLTAAATTAKQAHFNAFFNHIPNAASQVACGLTHEWNEFSEPLCSGVDTTFGNDQTPSLDILQQAATSYFNDVNAANTAVYNTLVSYVTSDDFLTEMKDQGWAGMGVWYFKIQQMNQAMNAILKPTVMITPGSLEGHSRDSLVTSLFKDKEEDEVLTKTATTIEKFDGWWTFESLEADPDSLIGRFAAKNVTTQGVEDATSGGLTQYSSGGSGVVDYLLNKIFGDLSSDFTLIDIGDQDVYPLTQLMDIGDYMLTSALVGYVVVALLSVVGDSTPVLGGALGDLIGMLLTTLLFVGLMLKYYIPIVPWIRVTFAVLSWIASVFEAVIIVPLLALANLSTEGEGLFTQTGRNLWISSLNVIMRPILTVIGFIASILMFNAMVGYVNSTFNVALMLSGHTGGMYTFLSIIVYSVIYMFVIYTLMNATFKTIDTLPDVVMRWMGGPQDVNFQDSNMEGYIIAASQYGKQVGAGLQKGAQNTGAAAGRGIGNFMKNRRNSTESDS